MLGIIWVICPGIYLLAVNAADRIGMMGLVLGK